MHYVIIHGVWGLITQWTLHHKVIINKENLVKKLPVEKQNEIIIRYIYCHFKIQLANI